MAKRRTHTDATKKRLVAKAFKLGNVQEVADGAKIAHSMLRNWCRDKQDCDWTLQSAYPSADTSA